MMVEWPSDFAEHWYQLPPPSNSIWKHSVPEDSEPSRIRNALELLCGALWHLELAKALGNFPVEGITDYRGGYRNFKKNIYLGKLGWNNTEESPQEPVQTG